MSAKRIKAGIRIPVSELQPGGVIATLIQEDKGAEALGGFLRLLSMDGIGSDMTIQATGLSIPLRRENVESLFTSWMNHCDARDVVDKLVMAGLVVESNGRLEIPNFDIYVHTEGLSAGRMRAMRAQRKCPAIQSVEMEGHAQCDVTEAHKVTVGASQSDGSAVHNETEEASQCDTKLIRKERLIKEKNNKVCVFKEGGERRSPSAPIDFSCHEAHSADEDAMTECEAEADSDGGTDVELRAEETASVAPAKDYTVLGRQAMCSMEDNRAGVPWHDPSVIISSEERSGWGEGAGCGTVADAETESSAGCAGMAGYEVEADTTCENYGDTGAEMQAEATGIVATAFKSAELVRKEPLCSAEREISEIPMRHALASSTPEELPVEWEDVTGCGAQPDAQQAILNSPDAEPQVEALGIDPFRANSARLRERPLSSMAEFSSRPPRMDPRELLRTGRLSFNAKPLVEAFASKCPSLETKASTTAEIINALVAEALKTMSTHDLLRAFDLAESSDFLTGRDGRMREAPVTLDWVLQPRTISRILRGEFGVERDKKYARRDAYAIEFLN